jgi:hypothetical protein
LGLYGYRRTLSQCKADELDIQDGAQRSRAWVPRYAVLQYASQNKPLRSDAMGNKVLKSLKIGDVCVVEQNICDHQFEIGSIVVVLEGGHSATGEDDWWMIDPEEVTVIGTI